MDDMKKRRWVAVFSIMAAVHFSLVDALNLPWIRRRQANEPAPLNIPASQYWDGIDGAWSSFFIRVGEPAQESRVLISTAAPETAVVLPQGCKNGDTSCEDNRGGLFQINKSSTWKDEGIFSFGLLENNLGIDANGQFGLEKLALGLQGGATLDSQVVAGVASYDFYLGFLGLSPQPSNFTNFTNPNPSVFTTLRSQGLIPSLSWSYTAGASYRKYNKLAGFSGLKLIITF